MDCVENGFTFDAYGLLECIQCEKWAKWLETLRCEIDIRSGCSCVRRRRECELPASDNIGQRLAGDRQVTTTTQS